MKQTISYITLDKENITDFAQERNLLLKKTNTDWIMFVDSDEKITPELQVEINETINKNTNFNGFYIKRKIYFLGILVGEDKVLRLAKKNMGEWKRAVHEVWNVKGRVGILNNYIIHNTADNLQSYLNKMNNYSTIHAKENLKEGKRSNLLKVIFYPKLKFLQNFILGRGFVFSFMQATHSFLSWGKLWELQRK